MSSEVEQTAVLLRSLDITPPPSVQSVNSSIATSVSQGSRLEPARLLIDTHGQYSTSSDHPCPRRSLFDSFYDAVDTPVTQSPTTPDRHDQFDPPIGINSFASFDSNGGRFLSRHTSQEAIGKPYSFHGPLSREIESPFPKENNAGQANPAPTLNIAPNGSSDASMLTIRSARPGEGILSGHTDVSEITSLSAVDPKAPQVSTGNSLNGNGGGHTHSTARQHGAAYPSPFPLPLARDNGKPLPLHEPVPYLRSPSPYWRYLPGSGSDFLPQPPLSAILGTAAPLDGNSNASTESMKQDGWVTSVSGYQDMTHQDQPNSSHRHASVMISNGDSWNGGIAPWSAQQPPLDELLPRGSAMEMNSATGDPKKRTSAMGTYCTPSFSNQSALTPGPNHEPSATSYQGDSYDSSVQSSVFAHSTVNGASAWPPTVSRVSPPKAQLTRNKANFNYPITPNFASSFVPGLTSAPDSHTPQFLSQVQSMGTDQLRGSSVQPRFTGSRLEDDEVSCRRICLGFLRNGIRTSTFSSSSNLTLSHLTMFS